MTIDLYCTNGSSPPRPPSREEASNRSPDGMSSDLFGLKVEQVAEEMRKRIRKLSYLGLHPETIRVEIEAETAILLQALLVTQAKSVEIDHEEPIQEPREVGDLKVCQIEDNRFYSVAQVESSFRGIVNLESLRKCGMVTRGGWTLGSSLLRALGNFFSKSDVDDSDNMGGNNGTGNQNPRLRSDRSPKRLAGDLGRTNKKRGMVQPSGGSTGGLENELENLKRLRAGKGSIQAKNS